MFTFREPHHDAALKASDLSTRRLTQEVDPGRSAHRRKDLDEHNGASPVKRFNSAIKPGTLLAGLSH